MSGRPDRLTCQSGEWEYAAMQAGSRYARFDVLTRRGIALLVETAFMAGVVAPASAVLLGEPLAASGRPSDALTWIVAFGVVFCLRDIVGGGTSPVKRLLGLRVVRDRKGHRISRLALRNLIWVTGPSAWVIEGLASIRGRGRFGDRMVGTRVVDVAPECLGYWNAPLLLGAYFLPNLAYTHVGPAVIAALT